MQCKGRYQQYKSLAVTADSVRFISKDVQQHFTQHRQQVSKLGADNISMAESTSRIIMWSVNNGEDDVPTKLPF